MSGFGGKGSQDRGQERKINFDKDDTPKREKGFCNDNCVSHVLSPICF